MSRPQPAPPAEAVRVMARLAEAGIRLAPDGPNLRYSSPVPLTPELRELIIAHKAVLLAYLSIWSGPRALALEQAADALVEQLGVSGTDPAIQEAATRCAAAGVAKDMGALRLAVFELEARARKLAAEGAGDAPTA